MFAWLVRWTTSQRILCGACGMTQQGAARVSGALLLRGHVLAQPQMSDLLDGLGLMYAMGWASWQKAKSGTLVLRSRDTMLIAGG